jgi:TIR domain
MVKIFINYRRGDTIATAGRLHDRLAKVFGRDSIFMDVDHIPAGVDFVGYLQKQIAACDVLLALIGHGWLNATDHVGQRRIDDPTDFVAIELASALARDIPLIPVLIDGAPLPPESALPERLKGLSKRNAVEVRNTQFGSDADRLVEKVRAVTGARSRGPLLWSMLLGSVAVAAGGLWYMQAGQSVAPLTANPEPTVVVPLDLTGSIILPAASSYCEQVKRVVAAVDTRFEDMLGKEFGNSRIATVSLPNWDDCVVFMENKFVDRRRYGCSVTGFANLKAAESATDDAAKALKDDCLGKGWVLDRTFETDGKRRTRLLSEISKSTITFAVSRLSTDPAWKVNVNVE